VSAAGAVVIDDDDRDSWDDWGSWRKQQAGAAEEGTSDPNARSSKSTDVEFDNSWQAALDRYEIDDQARLQLALLRDLDYHAAAECLWKTTKRAAWNGDGGLQNPSGFLNRACTNAFKALNDAQ